LLARTKAVAAALVWPMIATGCLSQVLPEPETPAVTYDFGPPPETAPAPLPERFRLDAVTAPSWLRSANIYYRKLDEQPAALMPYAKNRWIASPAELFAERLSYRVARAEPEVPAEALPLALELVSFEHVYASQDRSYVVARARASYDGRDGTTRERSFEKRIPAAASVHGATAELPRAADALLDDVLAWLREAPQAAAR
jgi:cholesterol transport system auxiliary component